MTRIGLGSWNESARQYDSYEKKWNFYGTIADEVVRNLPIKVDSRVLELACGTGACTIRLAKAAANGKVATLDFSEGMMEVARENIKAAGLSNVEFVQGDAGQISSLMAGRKFDVAACNSAFWHFPEPERVLGGLSELLKEGGAFALSLPSRVAASAASRSAFETKMVELLMKNGVTLEEIQKAAAQRTKGRIDFAELLRHCGFKLTESTFQFRVPEESRRDWSEISAFSGRDRWARFTFNLDPETQKKVREELSRWRDANSSWDRSVSRWQILVARPIAGWTPE